MTKIAVVSPDGKRDYFAELLIEGFEAAGCELVVSDPGNGGTDRRLEDDEFLAAAAGSDMCVVFFGKARGNRPPRRHLAWMLGLPRDRIAYLDGSEWSCTGWQSSSTQLAEALSDPAKRRGEPWLDEEMLQKCGHYFKREAYAEDLHRGVVPLLFGLAKRHILEPRAKDIDVFCSFGHVNTGLRAAAVDVVKAFAADNPHVRVVARSGMDQAEYRDTLSRSRIVIDAHGGGDCCDRFWEAIGAGACCLYQRYNIVTPGWFTDGESAVSWNTAEELKERLLELVSDAEHCEQIAVAGMSHASQFHTAEMRAREVIGRVLG